MPGDENPFQTVSETMTLDEVNEVLETHLGSTRSAYEAIIRELVREAEAEAQGPADANGAPNPIAVELEQIAREVLDRGGPAWQDLQIRIIEISKRLAHGGG